jgi:uncharacterized protein (TIGR03067 family)
MSMSKRGGLLLGALVLSGLGVTLGWGSPGLPPGGQDKAAGELPDADRIVGIWKISKGIADGKEMPAEFAKTARLTFNKDGKCVMNIANEDKTYKLLAAGKIDLIGARKTELGIYKFDGNDSVTICLDMGDNKKRPIEFAGGQGTGQVLLVLARAKPGEEIAKGGDKVREAGARQTSEINLKIIGLAMHNYAASNKTAFPPHAIYDKDGKTPLLSWRVTILPYIEQGALYHQFKLDEPWDSEHNKKLIAKMPKEYMLPVKQGEGMTNYQVFTGPGTVFNGNNPTKLLGIPNGTSNTILAVEAKEPVIWTKPADLSLPKGKGKMPAVGGHFENGFQVLMCDGSVRTMPADTTPAKLREMALTGGK